MPLYEYICLGCEENFEARREVDAPHPVCPACGVERVRRRFSVFAARPASSSPGGSGPAGCGCGGACACGR